MAAITNEEFWFNEGAAKWRMCREGFICNETHCDREIHPGDKYLDTGELFEWPKTIRICEHCAKSEAK